ncbi:hypothetical protein CYMTET_40384 [Cymbomonas tetramitiformis]|uniref:SnoaL-like domain-containing protein n=1 Tax=Cymbomonas tetramitiformis TaxID=36881 RepID=A0AAE0CA91_9CHLO|nr:hypothetical protein CYMTET_40384 [Cymbomonas tetramitiformis]
MENRLHNVSRGGIVLFLLALALAAYGASIKVANKTSAMDKLAEQYFEVWNQHDVEGLKGLLAPDASLRDWDVSVSGADKVAEANAGIFKAVPGISIEVLKCHPSPTTNTVSCEIIVHLNKEKGEKLLVTDVIEYTAEGKILAVRAYKG